jgi:hypothetical protein
MKIIVLGIVLLNMALNPAYAAPEWAFQKVSVKDILVYYQDGNNVVTVQFDAPVLEDTGCAPTDTHHIVSYWNNTVLKGTIRTWVSVLLSAQAQGLPVDLWVDMNNCSTGNQWDTFGTPAGLGLRLFGVRIAKE